MQLIQYKSDFLTSLTKFYNNLTTNCYPIMEEEFALTMKGVLGHRDDKDDYDLGKEAAFVVMQKRHL